MSDLAAFQLPQPLEDHQVVKMRQLQEGTLYLAKLLVEILPNVEDQQKAIEALKDVKLFGESAIRYGRTILTPAVFAQHMGSIEAMDHRVVRAWMNAHTYADIRKWGRDILDVQGQVELLKKGFQAVAWNVQLWTTRKIKPGFIVLISDEEAEKSKDTDLQPGWEPRPDQIIRL